MTPTLTEPIPNRTPEGATSVVKFHASLNVRDLPKALTFYRALFGTQAAKHYEKYAKFEIDEPPLILSLKPQRCGVGGPLNHLGLRVRSIEELRTIESRLVEAGFTPRRQDDVKCCYAHQTKFWVTDPDEVLWEVYVLFDDHPTWGEGSKAALMMPPLRAMGFMGAVRRWLSRFRTSKPKDPSTGA